MRKIPLPLLSVLFCAMLTLSGCSVVQIVTSFDEETKKLKDGENYFKVGNYTRAETLFSEVYQAETDKQTHNTAAYYLAATRILTSENNEELYAALEILREWNKPHHSGIYVENPTLLVTAILGKHESLTEKTRKLQNTRAANKELIARQSKEIKQLKENEKQLADQLQAYQQDRESSQEMINTLRRQIEELEAIEQQLLEKKKPL